MNWWKSLKGKVKLSEFLNRHTTFKIGGPAEFFIEPRDIDNLKLLLNFVKRYKIPLFIIGAGSNVLIDDKGVNGVVLRLNSPYFRRIIFKNNRAQVGSGIMLNRVVCAALEHGLSKAEFLVGIPGTVGGALVMNAGIWQGNHSIKDLVDNVTVMDYIGNVKTLERKDIKFGYRESSLSKYIVLSACLNLVKKNKKEIRDKIAKYLACRRNTQDLSLPNAGCIFKNPDANSAGRLIDLCGLKGKRIGGALVSLKHANFILNCGNATARDVLRLMDIIKRKVKRKFRVDLEPEIKIWR